MAQVERALRILTVVALVAAANSFKEQDPQGDKVDTGPAVTRSFDLVRSLEAGETRLARAQFSNTLDFMANSPDRNTRIAAKELQRYFENLSVGKPAPLDFLNSGHLEGELSAITQDPDSNDSGLTIAVSIAKFGDNDLSISQAAKSLRLSLHTLLRARRLDNPLSYLNDPSTRKAVDQFVQGKLSSGNTTHRAWE